MTPFPSPRGFTAPLLVALSVMASAASANLPVPLPPPADPCPPLPCPPAAVSSVPCPPVPCRPAAVQTVTAPQPRIVVNVPPPEVVYQDVPEPCRGPLLPRLGLFQRMCRTHDCRAHQCGAAPAAQSVVLTPMQSFTTGSAMTMLTGGLNVAAPNTVGVSGLTLVPVQQPMVAQVSQATAVQQSAAPSGLAAIHQAELFAAQVSATRAQQDAELRVMMSALDRARGSMTAQVSGGAGGASTASGNGCPELSCESIKTLYAVTEANSKQIGTLAGKMTTLNDRLDALTRNVEALTKQVDELNAKQNLTLDAILKLKKDNPTLK